MKIDRRARKYVAWVVQGADEAMVMDVTFDNGVNWYTAVLVGVVTTTTEETGISVTGLKVQVLVRGPDAADWTDAIPLVLGNNRAKLRVTDSPEIDLGDAGTVTVT